MKQLRYILIASICMLCLQSTAQKNTPEDYISIYKTFAVDEMKRSGIPASITLSQGILESGSGNSMLAVKGNNHFGIKCHRSWSGERLYYDDDEKGECFRSYKNAYESFKDHSDFLSTRQRYAFLFELDPLDYKGWAKGLKKAGYATDPSYAHRLIKLIEKYSLSQYDQAPDNLMVDKPKEEQETPKEAENPGLASVQINNLKTVVFDTNLNWKDIAHQNYTSLEKILKHNDVSSLSEFKKGDHVFVVPKRTKGSVRYHVVQKFQTMHSISQMHGIKLKSLYKRNGMPHGSEAAIGEKLFLQGKNPKTPQLKMPATDPKNQLQSLLKLKYHRVMSHESLTSIGRLYGYTREELKDFNNMDSAKLKTGQFIIVGFVA